MPSLDARIRPERSHGLRLADLVEALRAVAPCSWATGGEPASVDLRGDVTVTGIESDHRAIEPGDIFVALPGARVHGAQFAAQARAAGAVAVLTDAVGAALVGAGPMDAGRDDAGHDDAGHGELPLPALVVDDVRSVVGAAARAVHGDAAAALATYAVTGTNGKTTTTYLLEHLLQALGRRTGLIGTVETRVAQVAIPSRLTTPDTTGVHARLARMREARVDDVVMEVSSHALALHRVDGIVFDVAGFTNLSQDHLDFHGDLERYFAAKATLFTPARARRGVVLVDDPWGRRLAEQTEIPVVTLRTRLPADSSAADLGVGAGDRDPTWTVQDVQETPDGTSFTIRHRDGRTVPVLVALPGRFNVANSALAVIMAVEAGHDVAEVAAALAGGLRVVVPGRMEVVSDAPRCVVDFAHNPQALELALQALRATTTGRLHVVFGATGDRDRTKRPTMGEVAARIADVVVITDDDPHSEDPDAIRAQVLAGAPVVAAASALAATEAAVVAAGTAGTGHGAAGTVTVREVAPRAVAIRTTVLAADPADTVLVAGRGHEVWQEVAGVDLPLDDRVEVRAALAERSQVHP